MVLSHSLESDDLLSPQESEWCSRKWLLESLGSCTEAALKGLFRSVLTHSSKSKIKTVPGTRQRAQKVH